jgi:sucrose-6F-phosphate phosphohydrolase
MLASDMDGTVIPMEVSVAREREIVAFKTAVETQPSLALAYVTGRDLPLALKGMRQHRLPAPDTLVCDVGTSVYHATPSGYEKDQRYVEEMEKARGGLDVREVRHEMAHIAELTPQGDDRQSESKLSYYLSPGIDHRPVVDSVSEILEALGGNLQVVYSVGAPRGTGLLDVLPAGVAKDFAIRYLHDQSGLNPDGMIYAGDSGNDLAAMLTGHKVIVVGNATPGLKEELMERGGKMGILDRLYFAKKFYAAGVMEGCRHFGVL